ncbi:MAG: glycosyltransferase [Pseudomonadota bacterium]
MPKVSVVMPCYNVAAYVGTAVESVLCQTFRDFELILVDDGSTDETPGLCAPYLSETVRLVRQKNRGLAGARNSGIREATGEYIALLDSDDLWLPQKLEKHVALLEARPEVGISFDPATFIDDQGVPLGIIQKPKLEHIEPQDVFTRNPIGNGSAPVIRRAVLDQIAFEPPATPTEEARRCWFDESFTRSEDIELWIRIALTTPWRLAGIAESLTLYRVSDQGLSANIPQQYESWERVLAKTAGYAPDFVARWGGLARAYQLRYLARRAVRLRDGKMALSLWNQSFATDRSILWREPKRTLTTLGAALLLRVLPRGLYNAIESGVMRPGKGSVSPSVPAGPPPALRIAHVIDDPAVGGVNRVIKNLMEADRRGIFERETVLVNSRSFMPRRLSHDLIIIHYTLSWRKLLPLALFRILNPQAPMILVEHSYSRSFERLHVPAPRRFHVMLKLAYGLVDRVVANSYAVAAWMRDYQLVPETRLVTIQQSWDVSSLLQLPLPSRRQDRPLVVGTYGRFHEQKGFPYLIHAMARLSPERVVLRLGGFGPLEAELRQKAQNIPNITFVGSVTDLADFLGGCDVIAIPSLFEPFGLVCLEAKAAGRPVIATAVDGLIEQLESGCVLVPPADEVALAEAINAMADADIAKIGAAGRASVVDAFALFIQKWSTLLLSLTSCRVGFKAVPTATRPGQNRS